MIINKITTNCIFRNQTFGDALTANISAHYTKGEGYYEEYRYDDDFSAYGLAPVTVGDSVD